MTCFQLECVALTRIQQHAVGDAEEASALADQLREARVAARRAVDFLVDLVDQGELFFDVVPARLGQLQLATNHETLANHLDGRPEDLGQHARVERRGLAGVPGKDGYEQPEPGAFVAQHWQHQDGAAGGQRPLDHAAICLGRLQDIFGKLQQEPVDFLVVGAVAAPDAFPRSVVKAEALRPRNE